MKFLACLLVVAALHLPPAAGDEEDDPPAGLSQDRFVALLDRVLDGIQAKLRPLPERRVAMAANLWYAHEACIESVPLDVLTAIVDALADAGAARIDLNMGLFPWLEGNAAVIEKYDRVVEHIRGAGLALAINPQYSPKYHPMPDFAALRAAAAKVWPEIARRYRPEIFVVVHEPTTLASRLGARIPPDDWAAFARDLARAVKVASPRSRCGAGVISWEPEHFEQFVAVPEIDVVSFDLYTVKGFAACNRFIERARRAGKPAYVEETWRPVLPEGTEPGASIDRISAMGIGREAFAALDAKWLDTVSRWAGAQGLESVTPFWTPTFFHYSKEGGDAFAPEYNAAVFEAVRRGARTPTYAAFRRLAGGRRAGGSESAGAGAKHGGRKLLWAERLRDNGKPFGEWALMLADFAMTDSGPELRNARALPVPANAFYESHGFSPDDSRILYTGSPDGGLEIYEMELASARIRRLTNSLEVWDEHAHYSPDGQWIVWMSSRGLEITKQPFRLPTEYWIMDADGANARQLTHFNTPGHPDHRNRPFVCAADAAWSPDGRRLAAFLIEHDPEGGLHDQGELVMIELRE